MGSVFAVGELGLLHGHVHEGGQGDVVRVGIPGAAGLGDGDLGVGPIDLDLPMGLANDGLAGGYASTVDHG